jgi:hypothetical protein
MIQEGWIPVTVSDPRESVIVEWAAAPVHNRAKLLNYALMWATPCPIRYSLDRLGGLQGTWSFLLETEAPLTASLCDAFPTIDFGKYETEAAAEAYLRPTILGKSRFARDLERLLKRRRPEHFVIILKDVDRAHRRLQLAVRDVLARQAVEENGRKLVSTDGHNFICLVSPPARKLIQNLKALLVPAEARALTPEMLIDWLSWKLAAQASNGSGHERSMVKMRVDNVNFSQLCWELAATRKAPAALPEFFAMLEEAFSSYGKVPPPAGIEKKRDRRRYYLTGSRGDLTWSWETGARRMTVPIPASLILPLFEGRSYS